MKTILVIILLLFPITSIAGTAYWTGKFEYLGEDKNIPLWGCTYKDNNGKERINVMEVYCQPQITVKDKDETKQGSKGNMA